MKKLSLTFSLLLLGFCSAFATNDLVITSITRSGDCTTLKWLSHTGEFYTVYATEDLRLPIRWRAAAAFVPSGGTNTTWQEGCCSESFSMMSRAASGGGASLSKQERQVLQESAQARAEEGIKFLTAKLQETTNGSAVKSSGAKSGGGGAALLSSPSSSGGVVTMPTAKFLSRGESGGGVY